MLAERGLPRSVRADDRHPLARPDSEGDVAEGDRAIVIPKAESLGLDDRGGREAERSRRCGSGFRVETQGRVLRDGLGKGEWKDGGADVLAIAQAELDLRHLWDPDSEVIHEGLAMLLDDLANRSVEGQRSVLQDQQPVGDRGELIDLVLEDDNGVVPAEPADQVHQLVRAPRIEIGGRLVQEEDLRTHGEHGGNRDLLLLPA